VAIVGGIARRALFLIKYCSEAQRCESKECLSVGDCCTNEGCDPADREFAAGRADLIKNEIRDLTTEQQRRSTVSSH